MKDRINELRHEAKQMLPEFSPRLHARVMAAVRAEGSMTPHAVGHPWRYALAAAAVIAVVVGAWLLMRPAGESPTPRPSVARDFSIENPLPEVKLTLATDKGNPTYAYLDHDVAQFGKYIARQLDALPGADR